MSGMSSVSFVLSNLTVGITVMWFLIFVLTVAGLWGCVQDIMPAVCEGMSSQNQYTRKARTAPAWQVYFPQSGPRRSQGCAARICFSSLWLESDHWVWKAPSPGTETFRLGRPFAAKRLPLAEAFLCCFAGKTPSFCCCHSDLQGLTMQILCDELAWDWSFFGDLLLIWRCKNCSWRSINHHA